MANGTPIPSFGWRSASHCLLYGLWRRSIEVRAASALFIVLSVVKVFLFDLSGLEGVLRALSFIGLGLVLIAIGLVYQQFVFVRTAEPEPHPPLEPERLRDQDSESPLSARFRRAVQSDYGRHRAIAEKRAGLPARGHRYPNAGITGVFCRNTRAVGRAIQDIAPDAVLHLGLARRRKAVSVETRALNRLTIVHSDAQRRLSGTIHVEMHAEPVRRSRFAAQRLAVRMARAGAPSRVSIDAGDYLCNQVLYLSLGMHENPCGFIHIPRLRRLRGPRNAPEPALARACRHYARYRGRHPADCGRHAPAPAVHIANLAFLRT